MRELFTYYSVGRYYPWRGVLLLKEAMLVDINGTRIPDGTAPWIGYNTYHKKWAFGFTLNDVRICEDAPNRYAAMVMMLMHSDYNRRDR